MKNKEFDYDFMEMGDFFTASWTAKELSFHKKHNKTIIEELRLENLTNKKITIEIEPHKILIHPKKVSLKPKEVKHIELKIPCGKIKGEHSSYLILKTKNQKELVPIKIKHSKA